VSGQLHGLPLYPQGKSACYALDKRLGGTRAGLDAAVKRKTSSRCRDSNPQSSSPQPSAIPLNQPSYLAIIISIIVVVVVVVVVVVGVSLLKQISKLLGDDLI
jgi:hypothetical protein